MGILLELLLELGVEVVLQVVVEVLIGRGATAVGRAFGRPVLRAVAVTFWSCVFGFLGGMLWGEHLAGEGLIRVPRSVWVGLGLALVAAVLAFVTWRRGRVPGVFERVPERLRPNLSSFMTLALVSVAFVGGVELGRR